MKETQNGTTYAGMDSLVYQILVVLSGLLILKLLCDVFAKIFNMYGRKAILGSQSVQERLDGGHSCFRIPTCLAVKKK